MAKPITVVSKVAQELASKGCHHFIMLAAMAEGAGRMKG